MTPTPDGGVTPALNATHLLKAVPWLDSVPADLAVHDFRGLPGASLAFTDLLELATAIRDAVDDGASGIVVSQGTDTIEETAFLLDLLCSGDAPVIITGAMRHPSMAGADGPANILAAIQVAMSPQSRGLGCLVVFGDQVHAARWVCKAHTSSPAAFISPNHGPIGHVIEQRVSIPLRIEPTIKFKTAPEQATRKRVGLIPVTLGDDGEMLRSISESIDGLVVAGFGVGHVPSLMVPILTEIAERMPVVLASRTGAGPVHESTYGFSGSETDLLSRGLINAGYLHPYKARMLLWVLLSTGANAADISDAFQTAGMYYHNEKDG